jgi:hypothetical protein
VEKSVFSYGTLTEADRFFYYSSGCMFDLSSTRLDVSIGPGFEYLESIHCALGTIIEPNGSTRTVAVPCEKGVPPGWTALVGKCWKGAFFGDFYFTRLEIGAPPMRLVAWEGPASVLSSCC